MTHEHRLILGGARSGKSAFAERKILDFSSHPAYLATGQSFDEEMDARVQTHQTSRDKCFVTYECPIELEAELKSAALNHDAILVDCLTLWVSNLMMQNEPNIDDRCAALANEIGAIQVPIIFVSNEVGLGIVPDNKMARQFRDHAGRLHQRLGEVCGQVTFVAAGLPLALKGEL